MNQTQAGGQEQGGDKDQNKTKAYSRKAHGYDTVAETGTHRGTLGNL